jgi:hypothetical protein
MVGRKKKKAARRIYERSCLTKASFATQAEADREGECWRPVQYGYPCKYCKKWHLASSRYRSVVRNG